MNCSGSMGKPDGRGEHLSQSISAARKALDDTAQPHVYIVTIPGWGYRFAAPVNALAEPEPSRARG